MDEKAKALVLRAEDYGENDKLAVLLTDTAGKIRVKIRGVKKAAAKLKFAAQPFCFMDAVIHRRGDYYSLVNALPLDLFYGIVSDLDNLYAASVVLEAADAMTRPCAGGEFLPVALRALSALSYGETKDTRLAVCRFLSDALVQAGYTLSLTSCTVCGAPVKSGPLYCFDLAGGGVKCGRCAKEGDRSVKAETYGALAAIRETEYEALDSVALPPAAVRGALAVYGKLVELNFSHKLVTLSHLARI